jgi:hypothetical protein
MSGNDEGQADAKLTQDVEAGHSVHAAALQNEDEVAMLRARIAELEDLIEALKLEFGTTRALDGR